MHLACSGRGNGYFRLSDLIGHCRTGPGLYEACVYSTFKPLDQSAQSYAVSFI